VETKEEDRVGLDKKKEVGTPPKKKGNPPPWVLKVTRKKWGRKVQQDVKRRKKKE